MALQNQAVLSIVFAARPYLQSRFFGFYAKAVTLVDGLRYTLQSHEIRAIIAPKQGRKPYEKDLIRLPWQYLPQPNG